MKKLIMVSVAAMGMMFVSASAQAEGGHDKHGSHSGHDMSHANMSHDKMETKQDMFLVKKEVDGYTVTFHLMEPTPDMQHGGSHNLMIKLEHGNQAIEDAKINSKVFYPDGSSESKMLMLMDGWYMNGYDIQGTEKHGLMILFKTADGVKHKASVYYPKGM